MKSIFLLSSLACLPLFFPSYKCEAQTISHSLNKDVKIEVIQFHSEHRCETCYKIEELSRKVLMDYPDVPFSLINVDDDKNEKIAERFEAFGTALFLYNQRTDNKKDLTDFAFMNVHDKEKFVEGLKKEIEEFLKL